MIDERQAFQGVYLPPYIIQFLITKQISLSELAVLTVASALTRYGVRDCSVTNGQLAVILGVGRRQVCKVLSRMIERGLLAVTKFDGRTRWMRPNTIPNYAETPEDVSLDYCSTPAQRKRVEQAVDIVRKQGFSVPWFPDRRSYLHGPVRSPTKPEQTDSVLNGELKQSVVTPVLVHSKSKQKPPLHPRYKSLAKCLAEAIASKHKVNCTSKLGDWARELSKMHTVDGVSNSELRLTMRWYCQAYREQVAFLPICDSGRAFRQKYVKVRAAMTRAGVKGPAAPKSAWYCPAGMRFGRTYRLPDDMRVRQPGKPWVVALTSDDGVAWYDYLGETVRWEPVYRPTHPKAGSE